MTRLIVAVLIVLALAAPVLADWEDTWQAPAERYTLALPVVCR